MIDVDKGTVVRGLVAEHDEQHGAEPLRALAAFGDDVVPLLPCSPPSRRCAAGERPAAAWRCAWAAVSTPRARERWLRRRLAPSPALVVAAGVAARSLADAASAPGQR